VKITADKIAAQLAAGLAPCYFVTGDEPLLVGEAIDAIRATARTQGYEERESHAADARFDWAELRAGLDNLSLFASRKIVEVRLVTGKPGRQGSAAIVDLLADLPPDNLFIFSSPYLDKRAASAKWAQAFQQHAVWVDIRPLPQEQLPRWIGQRMQAAGLTADPEALEVMAARVEGNLLAAQQEISKLALLVDGHVSADVVLQSVADGARYDVFQLADAAIGQDLSRALRILQGLRREGIAAPLVLWALAREVTGLAAIWTSIDQGASAPDAMRAARVWGSRQPLLGKALRAHNANSVRQLVALAAHTDKVVKGKRLGQPWNTMLELVMLLAGPAAAVRVA
jgi:DNA polymerase-3 subunit delta